MYSHRTSKFFILLLGVFCRLSSWAQPQKAPLFLPLEDIRALSGTFGELRPAHFHSGLDIKTNGIGHPVFAAAFGYVSRIKVSAEGYGLALYLSHPGGFVTQYGHLDAFNEVVRRRVLKQQYKEKSWEVDFSLTPSEIPVVKGETIAWSGNTGGSAGPHLHFEIRDEKTETVLNPLAWGLKVPDSKPPVFRSLKVTPSGSYSRVNGQVKPYYFRLRGQNGRYSLGEKPIRITGAAGFAIELWDQQDLSPGKNGVYSLVLKAAGDTVFHFQADHFHFRETRYSNAFLDYQEWIKSGRSYFRCFRLPGNLFPWLKKVQHQGLVTPSPQALLSCEIIAQDFAGNVSSVDFLVESGTSSSNQLLASTCGFSLTPFKAVKFEQPKFKADFPEGAVYDTLCLKYELEASRKHLSDIHHFHTPEEPLHTTVECALFAPNLSKELREKVAIVQESPSGKKWIKGQWQNEWFSFRVKAFGSLYLKEDLTSPAILPLNITDGKSFQKGERFFFLVQDQDSGIGKIEAKINDAWVPAAYDAKTGKVIIEMPESLKTGTHKLLLTIEDLVKNTKTTQLSFKIP